MHVPVRECACMCMCVCMHARVCVCVHYGLFFQQKLGFISSKSLVIPCVEYVCMRGKQNGLISTLASVVILLVLLLKLGIAQPKTKHFMPFL